MKRGLDGVRVFHTLYRRRVMSLAERTRSMWLYNGPSDLDRASPEDLPDDEVWSRLGRVLQLKPRERVEGRPVPFNSSIMSTLVCSLLFSPHVFLYFSYMCIFLLGVTRSAGAWKLHVLAAPSQGSGGRGQAGRLEGGGRR